MSDAAKSFQELTVWRLAHRLVLDVYAVTRRFPRDELYGLTSQIRRAAVSVPANIAEGFRRRGLTDKARFLNIAESSLEEVRYYFILATDLGYHDCRPLLADLDAVARLLNAYTTAIRKRSTSL